MADAVFAALIVPDVDLGPAVSHTVGSVFFAAVALVAFGATAAPADEVEHRGRLGVVEVVTMLALVNH